MNDGRRDFLKIFGVASAVVVTDSAQGATAEVVKAERPANPPLPQPEWPFPYRTEPQYLLDVQKGRLYSAVDLPAGAEFGSHLCLFGYASYEQAPRELNGRRATLADTNLYHAMRLDQPEMFLIEQVGLVFSPATDLRTYRLLVENFGLSVWLGQKMYQRAPFSFLSQLKTADSQPTSTGALLDIRPYPLVIQPGQAFYARPEGETVKLPGRLRMWLTYEGRHARGVQ